MPGSPRGVRLEEEELVYGIDGRPDRKNEPDGRGMCRGFMAVIIVGG